MACIKSLVLLLLLAVTGVHGYGEGAPVGKCDTMTPQHYGATIRAADGSQPFSVKTNTLSYTSGDDAITVMIEGTADTPLDTIFKGFMLQARNSNGTRVDGTFSVSGTNGTLQLLACGDINGTAVTHTKQLSDHGTPNISVTWMPAKGVVDNVTFVATVVQRVSMIYTGVSSSPVSIAVSDNGVEILQSNYALWSVLLFGFVTALLRQ